MPTSKKSVKKKGPKKYAALQVLQRTAGPRLVIFRTSAGDALNFAKVGELGPYSKGPQREQKEARVDAIAKYFDANEENTIPSAVIIAFPPGAAMFAPGLKKGLSGTLTIVDPDAKNGQIVDGQHRLYGMWQSDPDMEVAIVALLDANQVEQAFQFLVINNKSSKVPATHTKALLAKMRSTNLAARLRGAKMSFDAEGIKDVDLINSDPDSPFYQSIDWTTTPKGQRMVQATAIETALGYLDAVGIPEYADRDIRRTVLMTMWSTIKKTWPHLWEVDSRLIAKVGILSLTRFITDRITTWADSDELNVEVTNLEEIERVTAEKILRYMDPRFFEAPWADNASGGFDTNQGRERVFDAVTQLFRNGRREIPWYTDIEIIDRVKASKMQ